MKNGQRPETNPSATAGAAKQTKAKKIRISTILARKRQGKRLTMLTAYDYSTARLLDEAGVDMLLVGDSAAMVVHGHDNTLPITMETMLDHTSAVCRGRKHALLIADMPFMSYQVSIEQAITNAGRFVKEAGAEAVKLEGGTEIAGRLQAICDMGIPVMAHIGLSYQRIHQQSGAKVQGRKERDKQRLIESALALEKAGAFSIILELIQDDVAAEISKQLTIPTIGIGSGIDCDGQVLVTNDILGLYDRMKPKFVRVYADLGSQITKAARDFCQDVKTGSYPGPEETFAAVNDEGSDLDRDTAKASGKNADSEVNKSNVKSY